MTIAAMAKVQVTVPLALLKLAGNQRQVQLEADDVSQAVARLDELFPGFASRIYDKDRTPHRHVAVYVDRVAVRRLDGHQTVLSDGDEIAIFPAIGGG